MTFFSSVRWTVALLLLFALNAFTLFTWTKRDTRPLAWDQAIHMKIAFEYRDRLATESVWQAMKPVDMNYPPLYHLAMVPFLNQVPDVADVGVAVNAICLFILIFAVFLIGSTLTGPWAGFAAATVVSCYPALIDLSRTTLIDLSLTTGVAVAFLCLLRSENFSRPLWSLGFGVSLALAMLTKWTAFAYISVPLIVSVVVAVRERRWGALFVVGVVCLAIMWPWYIQNTLPMLARIPKLSKLPPASGENLSGIANVFWYPLSLFDGVSLPFLLLALPGVVAVFWRPKLWPVTLWFVGSVVLFSLITNRNVRYIAPALPALAVLSTAWLPLTRKLPQLGVALFSIGYLVAFNFYPQYSTGFDIGRQRMWVLNSRTFAFENWPHRLIIDKVRELKSPDASPANVLVVSNTPYFHSTSINMTARAANLDRDVMFHGPSRQRWFEFADFILTKTGDLGPEFTLGTINKVAAVINKPEPWFPKVFKPVAQWDLPDASVAVLYQCKPDPENMSDVGLFNLSLDQLDLPNVRALGVELKATPFPPADTKIGRFKDLLIRCKKVVYKGIEFSDVSVRLFEPQINIPLFLETQQIQLLHLKALEPQASASADVLLSLAAEKAKWLKNPRVVFEGPMIRIGGSAFGVPLSVEAEVNVDNDILTTRLQQVRIGGMPVPLVLVRAVADQTVSLKRNDDWSYDLNIGKIQGTGTILRVGK